MEEGPWWSPISVIGDVAVVHVDLRRHPAHESEAAGWLNKDELSRLDKFLFPGAGRRYTLCRAALRAILSSQLDSPNHHLSFDTTPYGKPYVLKDDAPASLRFNVSHSVNHGLIALSRDSEVGVDVEERLARRHLEGLIATVMGPDEKVKLLGLTGKRRLHLFYRIWTMKEALAKGSGTGLYTDFSGFQGPESMISGEKAADFRFPGKQSPAWTLVDLSTEDFAAALAYTKIVR